MTCLFPLDFVALSSFDYLQQLSSQILSGSPSSSTQNFKQFGSRQGSLATTLKNRSTSFSIKQKFLVLSATQNNIGTTCKLNISVVYISLKPDKLRRSCFGRYQLISVFKLFSLTFQKLHWKCKLFIEETSSLGYEMILIDG